MPLSAISARGDISDDLLLSSLAEGGGPRASVVEGSRTRKALNNKNKAAASVTPSATINAAANFYSKTYPAARIELMTFIIN